MQTLVLNVSYEPVRVVRWERALKMLFLQKADLVEGYDCYARSQHCSIPIPAVLRLNRYHKIREKVALQRPFVYARDGNCCQYCGEVFPASELTYDHVIPRSKGGRTVWQNIVTCCVGCNAQKGNRTPREANMPLLRKPVRPRWMPQVVVRAIQNGRVPNQWRNWISWLLA
jgi:5-methylcytosine-specific restriction endonuclease McrA